MGGWGRTADCSASFSASLAIPKKSEVKMARDHGTASTAPRQHAVFTTWSNWAGSPEANREMVARIRNALTGTEMDMWEERLADGHAIPDLEPLGGSNAG